VQSFSGAPCRALVELRIELWWSSMQSFKGAPCRALRGLCIEPLVELLAKIPVEPLVERCVELP
jgi:hypothetical protein